MVSQNGKELRRETKEHKILHYLNDHFEFFIPDPPMDTTYLWIGFNLVMLILLAVDLGIFHSETHAVSIREALIWTAVWIGTALLFNLGLYLYVDDFWPDVDFSNAHLAIQFFTAYVVEKSLSVDNIFVFLLIFSYFQVPDKYQHKVLFWGILGAIILRASFIYLGVRLISMFDWILYVFGLLLIFSGIKLAFEKEQEYDPRSNPVIRLFRKFVPVANRIRTEDFFVYRMGKLVATPLFVVLLAIETTDVIFAVDSIPAVLGVLKELRGESDDLFMFMAYTSNILAILGLRALFFALAGVMRKFHHLHYGLSLVLVFIGVKMIVEEGLHVHLPIEVSLGVISGVLTLSILSSLIWPAPEEDEPTDFKEAE